MIVQHACPVTDDECVDRHLCTHHTTTGSTAAGTGTGSICVTMTANALLKSKSYNYVASVVAAYWVISISMVYLNKVRFYTNRHQKPDLG